MRAARSSKGAVWRSVGIVVAALTLCVSSRIAGVLILCAAAILTAVSLLSMFGRIKLPWRVSRSHVGGSAATSILALLVLARPQERESESLTPAHSLAPAVAHQQVAGALITHPEASAATDAALEPVGPAQATPDREQPRTQDELHARVREAARLGRYRDALDAFGRLTDSSKGRSFGDGARCTDVVAFEQRGTTASAFGRRYADSIVDWNVRLTHWGRYRYQPHEFELRCSRGETAIVARTYFSFQSSDDAVRVVGRLHLQPSRAPTVEILFVLNGLHELVGGPPLDGVQH